MQLKENYGGELSSIELMTESRVVYILVEIRKLIERTNQKPRYIPLDFHCSWALHATMDRREAKRILKRFDEAYELLKDKSLDELQRTLPTSSGQLLGWREFSYKPRRVSD